jgi:site-specific DNA-methyltransferase (adenine-specific)/adenine-specific DNA-methyltransferase
VHLDWKKGHYVKTIIDEVFGEQNFLNEVVWYYRRWNIATNLFARNHDCILFYARNTGKHTFNNLYIPKSEKSSAQGKAWKSVIGEDGIRRSILTGEATKGVPMPDTWQISIINPVGLERTEIGYPTQKPEALLERIIKASSNPGDLVLDCFAGSGTTLAVAEKFGRRWIGVDCGKLAIYTMQKRLLNISESKDLDDPQKKKKYGKACKPFTLYNAGLYDFSKLKELPWVSWRFFALQLFQCRDEPHKIGGVQFDGYLKGASVLVFNHTKNPGARFTEETLEEIHEAVGKRVGNKMFIIAPALTFDFQQDYIDLDGVRYYALRIPYSIINELHQREFTALKQPSDEMAVNDTVEAVGFDFIRTPELKFKCGADKRKGDKPDGGIIKIQTFKSEAVVREPLRKKGNLETLSMVMLDYDYDGEVFDLDAVFYADALAKADWEVRFPLESLGAKLMAVFIDIYGNEARSCWMQMSLASRPARRPTKRGQQNDKARRPADIPQRRPCVKGQHGY